MERLSEIYFKDYDERFDCGYIRYLTSDYVIVELVDEKGYFDGYDFIRTSIIDHVESNTCYTDFLQTMVDYHQQKRTYFDGPLSNDLLESFLDILHVIDHVYQENEIISLLVLSDEEDYMVEGIINDWDRDSITLQVIDWTDLENQNDCDNIPIEDIGRLTIQQPKCQFLKSYLNKLDEL